MGETNLRRLGGAIAVVVCIAAVAFVSFAFKPLREVASARVLCPAIDEDGGIAAASVSCGAGGFNSVTCTNVADSTNVVYFGSSAVTSSTGYPVCTTASSCAGSTLSIDTHKGDLYCTTNTDSADGGTPIKCLCGW